jgi:hypothetical protein
VAKKPGDKLNDFMKKIDEKKKFGWEEEDMIEGLKIVIIKHMFT